MREMKESGIEWIGEIPEDWRTERIGLHYYNRNVKVSDRDYEPLSVTKNGVLPQLDTVAKTNANDDRKQVLNGDFVINSRSDRKQSCGLSAFNGSVSLIYTVLVHQSQGGILPSFTRYLLDNYRFAEEFYRWGTGIVADLWSTRWDLMKRIIVPIPDKTEQQCIADYLDRKCAAINRIIELQQTAIEKLKAYKQSMITEAVTKGLNHDVPMKDSGIEWIGKIPAHWETTTVVRIATVVRGASPRPAGDPRYFNGQDVPWITVAEVTKDDGKYIYETETHLTTEGAKFSRTVEEGTLLLSNSGATLGVPKITTITGCINDGSVAFYDLQINQALLFYIFKSRTKELRKQMQGYGQPNLNTSIIKSILIPLPPKHEQEQICEFLDKRCPAVDIIVIRKQAVISKLTEYKKSLIYEAVTGKREIV